MILKLFCLAAALQGRVIFEDLPRQTLCKDGKPWIREFGVGRACTETVSIEKTYGIRTEHIGEPRLWLDDTLLGPLRREHKNGGWQSPAPVYFSPGRHVLSIECGSEVFEIKGVRIGQAGPKKPSPPEPVMASEARPAPAAVPAPSAVPTPPPACPDLALNSEWRPGRPDKALWLSVLNGATVSTPVLAVLKPGQKLRWWFYVHPRPAKDGVRHPPVLLSWLKGKDGNWAFAFGIDHQELRRFKSRKKKDYEGKPLGYRTDKWTPLDLEYCPDGRIVTRLNEGEVTGEFRVDELEIPIKIQSSEIELEIKGQNT